MKDQEQQQQPALCANWRVPASHTVFGTSLHLNMDGGLVLVLYRDGHGWRAGDGCNAFVRLPHQLYTRNLEPIVELPPLEIVAVNLLDGAWVTIWAKDKEEISHPIKNGKPRN